VQKLTRWVVLVLVPVVVVVRVVRPAEVMARVAIVLIPIAVHRHRPINVLTLPVHSV
jgi:hypothetical protein